MHKFTGLHSKPEHVSDVMEAGIDYEKKKHNSTSHSVANMVPLRMYLINL